jgi:hypothetical protein
MLAVPSKALILVAALVWLAAGAGVASVGLGATLAPWTPTMFAGALAAYVPFLLLFLMIARKHIRRITGYTEKLTSIVRFLTPPSYLILVIMIGMGVIVRFSGLVPNAVIAAFYCGLGSALITAAIFYLVSYLALCEELAG